MSTSEEDNDHDASVVRSTGARAPRSQPEVPGPLCAKLACRYQRIATGARVEGKRRTVDTKALALAPVLDVLTERRFGEWTGNTFATTMATHE